MHRLWPCLVVILVVLLGAGSRAIAASDVPGADALRAHIRAAFGTLPPSSREEADVTRTGTSSHVTILRSGDDERSTYDTGSLHSEDGSYRGQRWMQNENGETILLHGESEDDDTGGAVAAAADPGETYVSAVVPISEPVVGYVLSTLDGSGYGTLSYVEAATWRVVREDDVRASGTIVYRYDDFRTKDGYTFAYHRTSSDGHPEDDSDRHVTAFAAAPVPAAQLAIPPARRTLVEFPNGKTTVTLPAHEEHQQFVVRVFVGSRGLDFLIDSGASGIVLEEGVAKSLGLPQLRSYASAANAGRYRGTTTVVPDMHVGELALHDVVVDTVPSLEGRSELGDYKVVGLLGFDFIADVALKLDYLNATVTASAPAGFAPPVDANGFVVDLRLDDSEPVTSITVNGAKSDDFLIDTGAYGSLIFFDRFARRHRTALVDEGGGANRDIRLLGIGGELRIKPYQLKLVNIGGVNFHDFVAYAVQNRDAYDDGMDGTIGPSFLQLFDIYFDYAHAKAYFIFNAG